MRKSYLNFRVRRSSVSMLRGAGRAQSFNDYAQDSLAAL